MKINAKKTTSAIAIGSAAIALGLFAFTVFAQTGYQRNSNYVQLSGSGSSNGSGNSSNVTNVGSQNSGSSGSTGGSSASTNGANSQSTYNTSSLPPATPLSGSGTTVSDQSDEPQKTGTATQGSSLPECSAVGFAVEEEEFVSDTPKSTGYTECYLQDLPLPMPKSQIDGYWVYISTSLGQLSDSAKSQIGQMEASVDAEYRQRLEQINNDGGPGPGASQSALNAQAASTCSESESINKAIVSEKTAQLDKILAENGFCKNATSTETSAASSTANNSTLLPPIPSDMSVGHQLSELRDANTQLESDFQHDILDINGDSDLEQQYRDAMSAYMSAMSGYRDDPIIQDESGYYYQASDPEQLAIEQKLNTELTNLTDSAQVITDNQGFDQSSQNPNDIDPSRTSVTLSPQTENDAIAKQLGLKPVQVPFVSGFNGISVYDPGTVPNLGSDEVLVRGGSVTTQTFTNVGDGNKTIDDTYYAVNKNDLPSGYVLQGAGEINTGGVQATDGQFGLPVLDANNVPVYNLVTTNDALAADAKAASNGVFKYDFSNSAGNTGIVMQTVNSLLTTVTGNDAIMGHISMDSYTSDADATLLQFTDYARSLSPDLPQAQVEKSVYDDVNNAIQYEDPAASSISLEHNLEQAVAAGQGVCRDKAAALEYALNAAGIPADEVIAPQHVFVAVLNSDGTVSHYLDPTYYETYIQLNRTNVNSNQLVHVGPPTSNLRSTASH